MAVFPERIVLKSTTDSEGATIDQIKSGGTEEIKPGELVIRRGGGEASLYTLDANGTAVQVTSAVDQAASLLNYGLIKLGFGAENTDDTVTDDTYITTSPFPSAAAAKYGSAGLELNGSESLEGTFTQNPGRIFTFGFWMLQHEETDLTSYTGTTYILGPGCCNSNWRSNYNPNVEIIRGQAEIDALTTAGYDTTGMVRGCVALFSARTAGSTRLLLTDTRDHSANDGQWHYYLFQGEAGGNYAVYVDGVLKRRVQNPSGEIAWEGDPFAIGGYTTASSWGLNGYMDGISWFANINFYSGSGHPLPAADPPAAVSVLSLENLNDVQLNSLATSDILSYNGTTWVNVPSAGNPSITFLDDLLDVDTSNLAAADGQTIKWNNTTSTWERADGLLEVEGDTSPTLGGPLDTAGYKIFTTTALGLRFDSETNGSYIFKHGATDSVPASIALESTGALGNVTLQAHGGDPNQPTAQSSYTIKFPFDGPQVLGDVLTYQGDGTYEYSAPVVQWGSILNAPYVPNFSATSPANGATWVYNTSNSTWEPGAAAPQGVTNIDVLGGTGLTSVGGPVTSTGSITVSLEDTAVLPGHYTSANITVDAQGRIIYAANGTGGGGGRNSGAAGTVERRSETQSAVNGRATYVNLGQSGILASVESTVDAWVVFYTTSSGRLNDAGRAYGEDPEQGSGVLAEFYVEAGETVLASPGTTYFNNDVEPASALYAAIRDQNGNNIAANVTVTAYAHMTFAGTGTSRVEDSATSVNGDITFVGLGQTGQFCTVSSSAQAWVVFYSSEDARIADSSRPFNRDPSPGSGVLAEFYLMAGETALATPGSTYFNNDSNPTDAIYVATKDLAGEDVDTDITVTAYAETSYSGISGGTFGSG